VPWSEQKTVCQQDVVLSFDFVYWVFLGVGIAAIGGFGGLLAKENPAE
jgi:hypothetical protein